MVKETIVRNNIANIFSQLQTLNGGISVDNIIFDNATYFKFTKWDFRTMRYVDLGHSSYHWKTGFIDNLKGASGNNIDTDDIYALIQYAKNQGWIN